MTLPCLQCKVKHRIALPSCNKTESHLTKQIRITLPRTHSDIPSHLAMHHSKTSPSFYDVITSHSCLFTEAGWCQLGNYILSGGRL